MVSELKLNLCFVYNYIHACIKGQGSGQCWSTIE